MLGSGFRVRLQDLHSEPRVLQLAFTRMQECPCAPTGTEPGSVAHVRVCGVTGGSRYARVLQPAWQCGACACAWIEQVPAASLGPQQPSVFLQGNFKGNSILTCTNVLQQTVLGRDHTGRACGVSSMRTADACMHHVAVHKLPVCQTA